MLLRFAGVGGVNTAVHWGVYIGLSMLVPVLPAHVGAAVVATGCSYLLHCRFTFGVVPSARSLLRYPVSRCGDLLAGAVAVLVLAGPAGVEPRCATIAAGALATPVTFVLTRAVLTRGARSRQVRA